MKTKLDLLTRLAEFMNSLAMPPTREQWHALMVGVYADGARDAKTEILKEAQGVMTNAATKRVESESGLSLQQGRRLAAEEIMNRINTLPSLSNDIAGWTEPPKRDVLAEALKVFASGITMDERLP